MADAGGAEAAELDVLVPTRDRPVELATTLAGLAGQPELPFRLVVSDQSTRQASFDTPAGQTMLRVLRHQGRQVRVGRHLPRRGMAEHRAFLLAQALTDYVLFLDDDVWLEPGALARLHTAITELRCGFVGAAVQGLSYLDDRRPHELEPYQEWPHPPVPERIEPGSPAWQRWTLHNAANPTHLAERVPPGEWRAYKVAWVGGCVLYDRQVLADVGGFDFWRELPIGHCGEDVLAQQRVMARCGGAGLLPSGAYHLESPTTVPERRVDAARRLTR
ncbi:MAG TPA: glycosyltransferase [Pseudonocardiaceae bacterium]|nr:glycosyltransferase [Pseudonocardiaceae bacterium]